MKAQSREKQISDRLTPPLLEQVSSTQGSRVF